MAEPGARGSGRAAQTSAVNVGDVQTGSNGLGIDNDRIISKDQGSSGEAALWTALGDEVGQ